jgi:ubiquinone/menaquinone biosynthesis C-methylase UbiE
MGAFYTHGYTSRESDRLHDQASVLTSLLHSGILYKPGHLVLEAGCGVGSQTRTLARNSPDTHFVAVDISPVSVGKAKELSRALGRDNVRFQIQDINSLSFKSASFDHVFLCFVLEHMVNPVATLVELKRVLKNDGSLTVIEGDHGSAYFHPDSSAARKVIQCQVRIQAAAGGNANIGRQLYPLIEQAGFRYPSVTPRMVFANDGRPDLMEGFTRKTFIAMMEGIRDRAVAQNLLDAPVFDKGIRDLKRTAQPGGTFCYTFFRGRAVK